MKASLNTKSLSKLLKLSFLAVAILFMSLITFADSHATVQKDDIMKKWVVTQYYNCLSGGNINRIVSSGDRLSQDDVRGEVMKESGELFLPSYNYGHSLNSDSINCSQLFLGVNGLNKGVVDYSNSGYNNPIYWSNSEVARSFLENVGYSYGSKGEDEITIKWNYIGRTEVYGSNGTIETPSSFYLDISPKSNNNEYDITDVSQTNQIYILSSIDNENKKLIIGVDMSGFESYHCSRVPDESTRSFEIPFGNNLEQFKENINNKLSGRRWEFGDCSLSGQSTSYKIEFGDSPATISNGGIYIFNENTESAVKDFTGASIYDYNLNTNERYTLYANYLVGAVNSHQGEIDCNEARAGDIWTSVSLKSGGAIKKCSINFQGTDPANISVYTQSSDGRRPPYIDKTNMQTVIEWLNNHIYEVDLNEVENTESIMPSNGDDEEDNCLSADIGFAYIVCPLIETITDVAEGIYSNFVEPSLRVEPQLFTGGTSNEVSVVWGTFRDIANTIFVIFLLLIIFSQLTGYGITNYGIKKLLPKLIIAVILINLSYLLCLGCVDLSNIVGNSLKGMFDNFGAGLQAIPKVDGQPLNDASSAGILSIGILGSIGTAAAIFLNPALIVTLLVTALGVLISIFFMFILLAARQAAIIVLIVISPVIMVLYVLPNTQKWFDKMLKIWWALILLYPIMGLLMGGGNFAAKLLLDMGYASSGTFQAFAAMVIGIIPIFLAPELVNNAFSGLNNVGAKIAGVGNKIGSTSTGAIKNTSGYKALQQAGAARGNRILAGIDKNGRPTGLNNLLSKVAGSKFGSLGYNRLYKARVESARKDQESQREATTLAGELQKEYADARNKQNDEKYFKERLEEIKNSTDDNTKLAVLAQMDRSNLQNSVKARLVRNAFGEKKQDKVFLQKCAQMFGNSFLQKDYEMFDWMRKGGISITGESTALGNSENRGQWAQQHADIDGNTKYNIELDDMKDDQVAALSSDNLYSLMTTKDKDGNDAPKITQAQAQRVWASNVNMDNTERLILGAYAHDNTKRLTKPQAQEILKNGSGYGLSEDDVKRYVERAPDKVEMA